MGRLLQHHPHAAAAKADDGWLPLHCALRSDPYDNSKGIKASCEAIGMILAAHPQVRTAQLRKKIERVRTLIATLECIPFGGCFQPS